MKAALRTRHVDLTKSALEFGELPLAEEPQSAHAEGEYWGDVRGRGEKGRGTEDGSITPKRRCKVDFLG